jgi:hypothetical protein
VSIVWINVLAGDTGSAVKQAAMSFIRDPRVLHFHDPGQCAGKAIARSLGARGGQVAWDFYLFYEKNALWTDDPPAPMDWMHQLRDNQWADSMRYHSGDDLVAELYNAMKELAGANS